MCQIWIVHFLLNWSLGHSKLHVNSRKYFYVFKGMLLLYFRFLKNDTVQINANLLTFFSFTHINTQHQVVLKIFFCWLAAHRDGPTKGHPGDLTILLSHNFSSNCTWHVAIPKHALEPAMSMVYKENIFFKYSIKKTLQLYTVFYLGYQSTDKEKIISQSDPYPTNRRADLGNSVARKFEQKFWQQIGVRSSQIRDKSPNMVTLRHAEGPAQFHLNFPVT